MQLQSTCWWKIVVLFVHSLPDCVAYSLQPHLVVFKRRCTRHLFEECCRPIAIKGWWVLGIVCTANQSEKGKYSVGTQNNVIQCTWCLVKIATDEDGMLEEGLKNETLPNSSKEWNIVTPGDSKQHLDNFCPVVCWDPFQIWVIAYTSLEGRVGSAGSLP